MARPVFTTTCQGMVFQWMTKIILAKEFYRLNP